MTSSGAVLLGAGWSFPLVHDMVHIVDEPELESENAGVRPVALALGSIATITHLVFGIGPFVSPGQDAFQAIGYFFGIISLALAAMAAAGTNAAVRGRPYAGVVVALPFLCAMGLNWLVLFD